MTSLAQTASESAFVNDTLEFTDRFGIAKLQPLKTNILTNRSSIKVSTEIKKVAYFILRNFFEYFCQFRFIWNLKIGFGLKTVVPGFSFLRRLKVRKDL